MLTQWDDLLGRIQVPVAFAGEIDAAAAKLIRRTNRSAHIVTPVGSVRRAAVLAEIGFARWKKQQVTDADALAPTYLREPG